MSKDESSVFGRGFIVKRTMRDGYRVKKRPQWSSHKASKEFYKSLEEKRHLPTSREYTLQDSPSTKSRSSAAFSGKGNPVGSSHWTWTHSPSKETDFRTHDPRELLRTLIRFVPASYLTAQDEDDMAKGRTRKVPRIGGTAEQRRAQLIAGIGDTWPSPNQLSREIRNPSNLCYRRSVLHVLFHAPVVVNWLLATHTHVTPVRGPNRERCLACALKGLVNRYWTGTVKQIQSTATAFDNTVKALGANATPPWLALDKDTQADAHEFLHWILQVVENKQNKPKNELDALFKFEHNQEWQCPSCNVIHHSPPTEDLGLIIGITHPQTGMHLRRYIQEFYNQSVQGIRCSGCKWTGTATQVTTIVLAPKVLFIQLRRFEQVIRKGRVSIVKLNQPVAYDLHLDLSAYNADQTARQPGKFRYRLASVISHVGTMNAGHYTTVATGPQGIVKLDNDSTTKSTPQELLTPRGKFTPYILAYIRT